jgi:hypothetical protein
MAVEPKSINMMVGPIPGKLNVHFAVAGRAWKAKNEQQPQAQGRHYC